MDAARRDAYLTALGVVRYRPRPASGPTTGALAEGAVVRAEESEQPVATTAAPTASGMPAAESAGSAAPAVEHGEAPLAALRERTREPVAVAAAGSEAPSQPAAAGAETPAALTFRLACWQPVPDLLVVDALPAGGWPDRERMALLTNILRAIGRLPGPLAAAEVIDWPPFAGADASLAGAQESLALFIAGRMAMAPFHWLLAMGESSWHCLGADSHLAVGDELALAGAARAILLPGLADLLAAPARKAETWRAIRKLAPAANG
jgi:hypothetical protein